MTRPPPPALIDLNPSSPRSLLRLRVTAAAESILRSGHPWLYDQSIRAQNRDGVTGELAAVYDRNDCFLAIGLFDADSPLRLRVLHRGTPLKIDSSWWQENFRQAFRKRDGLFDARTTGYRCINGESDGWPGLVLDRYENLLVVKLYTAAWLPRLPELTGLFAREISPQSLVLRLSRNIQKVAAEKFQAQDGQVLSGRRVENPSSFLENGLRFEVDVVRGQKTGFFLDQRENRQSVEALAGGRRVLNAFSFSGGFSLYAARGGATSVLNLDLSAHALAAARRNCARNESEKKIAACRQTMVQADVFEWLKNPAARDFDLIIIDPPSLARREPERADAIRAYHRLAREGIKRLAPDGILVAASCSAHVTADEFFGAVREAAAQSEGKFLEIKTTRQPADHPATFPEADYLKCIYLKFPAAQLGHSVKPEPGGA